MVNNTKAQDMIMKLTNKVQAKQNSFDDLATAHNDLQEQFDRLRYSMDTLDKQQLIKTAMEAETEAVKYKIQLGQTNELMKEMLDVQCQFQSKMDIHDATVLPVASHSQFDQW